jgi:hypothetical protein
VLQGASESIGSIKQSSVVALVAEQSFWTCTHRVHAYSVDAYINVSAFIAVVVKPQNPTVADHLKPINCAIAAVENFNVYIRKAKRGDDVLLVSISKYVQRFRIQVWNLQECPPGSEVCFITATKAAYSKCSGVGVRWAWVSGSGREQRSRRAGIHINIYIKESLH